MRDDVGVAGRGGERLARALLVVAVLGGLLMASTSIAQRLAQHSHSGRGGGVVQLAADVTSPDRATAARPDQHEAAVTPADLADEDAVSTDADLRDTQAFPTATRHAKAAMGVAFPHVPWLKGFRPPP